MVGGVFGENFVAPIAYFICGRARRYGGWQAAGNYFVLCRGRSWPAPVSNIIVSFDLSNCLAGAHWHCGRRLLNFALVLRAAYILPHSAHI